MNETDGILRIDSRFTSADAWRIDKADHVHDVRGGVERCIKRRSLSDPCFADPAAPKPKASVDYQQLAAGLDEMRETLNIMVAGLVNDGFTEEQARAIVAGVFSLHIKKADDDG